MDKMRSAGIEASREMVAWLWNNRVAAIGTDCPAVEAFPSDFTDEEHTALSRAAAVGAAAGRVIRARAFGGGLRAAIGATNSCWFRRR